MSQLFDALWRLLPPPLRPRWPAQPDDQLARLGQLVGLSPEAVAAFRLGGPYHYRPFTRPKANGQLRPLAAPSPALKALQRKLLDNYLAKLPLHPAAMAFRAGYSVAHPARYHAGHAVTFTADVENFFGTTSAARVRAFFLRLGWRDAALTALMRLCVWRNSLPQGAPTSPCLSNLVNFHLDKALATLTESSGGRYSRYGDDLAFSWANPAGPPGGASVFQLEVAAVLARNGYRLNPEKGWRIQTAAERPEMVGVQLQPDGTLRVPPALRRRVWWLRWLAWWTRDPAVRAQLAGYRGFIKMVEGR